MLALYRGIIPTIAGVAPYVSCKGACVQVINLTANRLALILWCMRRYVGISNTSMNRTRGPYESYLPELYLAPLRKRARILCKSSSKLTRNLPGSYINDSYSDVLRRRFQINTMSGMGYQYKSIWDAISTITAQEGYRGMYKGIVPNLLKVAPSMASSWLSFEVTRDFLLGFGNLDT